MGFCRRCGDIVAGTRCKCGGTAVAPVVSWNDGQQSGNALDKWSKTYVTREPSTSLVRREHRTSSPVKPHVQRSTPSSSNLILDVKVSEYISRTTSQPSSSVTPSKPFLSVNPNADILPSVLPHDTTLSKVYGSLLQPKESLSTHSCAICSVPFAPDATIYPDPSEDDVNSDRFLCRQCYISNGGSKGACALCSKPVLTLKSDGGFIHAAGKYWHKQCFNCDGCSLNVSDSPMVDLFGRPSCLDCFETCLKRDNGTPKKHGSSNTDIISNLGGMKSNASNTKFRESSPGIEELEQRLGIVKPRQSSPALEELSQRLNMIGKEISTRQSPSGSPVRSARSSLPSRVETTQIPRLRAMSMGNTKTEQPEQPLTASPVTAFSLNAVASHATGGAIPTQAAIEEMKQRFLKNAAHSPLVNNGQPSSVAPLRISRSTASLKSSPSFENSGNKVVPQQSIVSSPSDLTADFSPHISENLLASALHANSLLQNTNRQVSGESSSDFISKATVASVQSPLEEDESSSDIHYSSIPPSLLPDHLSQASCSQCRHALGDESFGGRCIVTSRTTSGKDGDVYHIDCFRCVVCDDTFNDGSAIATLTHDGKPAHIQCVPQETIHSRKLKIKDRVRQPMQSKVERPRPDISNTQASQRSASKVSATYPVTSSRYERSAFEVSTTPGSSSRFGSRTACPGCNKPVSPMEFGVVPGPQSTRWHSACLVCGGKKEVPKGPAWIYSRGREDIKKSEPGCGKKLDSAARIDHEGRVWCRACLLLLGIGASQSSPTRAPVITSHIGTGIIPQYTGGTTIARQFTGIGIGEPNILRQLTGGGLSPTRSISPTKQLSMASNCGTRRPRPKSAIGMRSLKSVDEGRGTFLIRQLTGGTYIPS